MAIKGFEKKDPMQQFNQMMQMITQMNQMQDREKESVSSNLSSKIVGTIPSVSLIVRPHGNIKDMG